VQQDDDGQSSDLALAELDTIEHESVPDAMVATFGLASINVCATGDAVNEFFRAHRLNSFCSYSHISER
jgi:hypothetical protein